jgi:hypothetical protein
MTRGLRPWAGGLALLLLLGSGADAQERTAPAPAAPAKYVTVNIEIHGLDESTRILTDASRSLASALEEMKSRGKDLSPEQLDRLTALAREMNELVRAAERTVQSSDRALERAREPLKALVADAVTSARVAGVDPVLGAIHGYVTTWLVIAIAGGLAALALSLYAFFAIGRQLRVMVATLKLITEEYELVRRQPPPKDA